MFPIKGSTVKILKLPNYSNSNTSNLLNYFTPKIPYTTQLLSKTAEKLNISIDGTSQNSISEPVTLTYPQLTVSLLHGVKNRDHAAEAVVG